MILYHLPVLWTLFFPTMVVVTYKGFFLRLVKSLGDLIVRVLRVICVRKVKTAVQFCSIFEVSSSIQVKKLQRWRLSRCRWTHLYECSENRIIKNLWVFFKVWCCFNLYKLYGYRLLVVSLVFFSCTFGTYWVLGAHKPQNEFSSGKIGIIFVT